MKFAATEDIAAPIDAVWVELSDLEAFEARARARVGGLVREPPGPPGEGTSWSGAAEVMGKRRAVTLRVARLDAPDTLGAEAETEGVRLTFLVELRALAPRLTRLTVTTEARAEGLAARLMLQSARIGRAALARRYKERVSGFAVRVEKAAR